MSELSDFNQKLKKAMGVNESPKITVNKLGEFLVASPKRQRRILEQLKYPKENTFGFTAYGDVRDAIKAYFTSEFNEEPIDKCITLNEGKTASNDYQATIINSSIEALDMVLDTEAINLDYTYEPYKGDNPKLNIKGVEVSVYPDLIVKCKTKNKEYIGALKIHLSKNSSVNDEGSKYIAAILHQFTENHISKDCKPELSISYDVFNDTFIECPKAVKRRLDDIEAGCMNIVAIWDSI